MTNRLANKVAIVTGGAAGIGLATVKDFLDEGAQVIFTDIDAEKGQQVQRDLADKAIFVQQDVSQEDDWLKLIARVQKDFGTLDILVNNAGVMPSVKPITEITTAEFQKRLDVNLTGTFFGTKYGMNIMKDHGGGSIVNISSLGGLRGIATAADYCATKGGVRLMSKAAALDAADNHFNVRVNTVHPGYIKTAMTPEAGREMMATATPIGRMGSPKEIADTILFLASDEASFITGTELAVDGGLTAR
ncbi:glucose 1-dehydrogenase [Levilactobacillus suantsaiihabitans]|uniref:Glucose 1-dehydrogenase n=1 Tax=Levilactobacillus suantsaiihabitans TaxID=2487722 RepID=A0A4Z0J7P6_9LACO|nr:glucose 1-dehydrogenase [Levilactobacillus suantsaiihabitans]TGD18674.1 glucose 1-dehydrogenase [Levilactobacillus suantsaiihabitans]